MNVNMDFSRNLHMGFTMILNTDFNEFERGLNPPTPWGLLGCEEHVIVH